MKQDLLQRYLSSSTIASTSAENFREHAQMLSGKAVRATAVIMIALCVLFWPTDAWVFRRQEIFIRAFLYWRLTIIIVSLILYHYLKPEKSPRVRPTTISGIGIAIIIGASGLLMGKLGGIDSPFFYGIYTAPLVTVLILVEFRERSFWTFLLVIVYLIFFFLANPDQLQYRFLGAPLVWLSAMSVTYIFVGHAAFSLIKINFLQGGALNEKNAQLENLTAGLEKKVSEQTSEIQRLVHSLISIQEIERSRIAMNLHDDLGQLLTSLNIGMQKMSIFMKSSDAEGATKTLFYLEDLLTRIHHSNDEAITSLAPRRHLDGGLDLSIRRMIENFSRLSGIDFTIQMDISEDGESEEILLTFYRIIQESLNNITRHSGASSANVILNDNDNRFLLEITDDGNGFDMKKVKKGLGLFSIVERSRQIGGKAVIESSIGGGSRIIVEAPSTSDFRDLS